MPLRVDARSAPRFAAAGRKHPPAEGRAAQHHVSDDGDDGGPDDQHGNGAEVAAAEQPVVIVVEDRHRLGLRHPHRVPRAMPIIASVVRNEGMPILVVSAPLTRPTRPPAARPPPRRPRRRNGPMATATTHRNQARHHADGQVDLGLPTAHTSCHRHDRDHRGLPQDVELVVGVEEPLVEQGRREKGEDQHEPEIGICTDASWRRGARRERVLLSCQTWASRAS